MKLNFYFGKTCFLLILAAVIPGFLFGQGISPAAEFENLFNTEVVTYSQASRFVLEAAEELIIRDPHAAFQYAVNYGWLPKNVGIDDIARLDHIAMLLANSFNINGGLLYSVTKNSRYAYRELKYMNVIQGRVVSSMPVSGERLIFYVNRMLGRQDIINKLDEKNLARERMRGRLEEVAAELTGIIIRQSIADTTVQVTDRGIVVTFSDIQFLADSAELPAVERRKINEIAGVLRAVPGVKIIVTGHTTNVGGEDYLLELSRSRARSVADYLVSLGVCEAENVIVAGYGGSRPIADNATPQGMAANRRVEITIFGDIK